MTNTGHLHWLLLLLETAAVSTTTGSRFSGATSTTAFENALCFCESKMFRCKVSQRLPGTLGRPCRPVLAFSWLFHSPKAISCASPCFALENALLLRFLWATQCFVYLLCSLLP